MLLPFWLPTVRSARVLTQPLQARVGRARGFAANRQAYACAPIRDRKATTSSCGEPCPAKRARIAQRKRMTHRRDMLADELVLYVALAV